MDNIFTAMPKDFRNKPLTAFGAKHEEVRLAADLVANRHKALTPDGHALFVAEGLWALPKIAEAGIEVTHFLFVPEAIRTEDDLEAVKRLIGMAGTAGYISSALSGRISDRDSTEGFFIVGKYPRFGPKDVPLSERNIVVVLDALDKPGNIGTIIRSTEGAGGDAVISAGSKVRLTHNRIIMSSLGASFTLPVFEMSTDECVEWLRANDFTVYLTLLDGEHFFYEPQLYEGRIAIVAGNEIRGVSGAWKAGGLRTVGVKIPMWGRCDSLNVGFATMMVAYEASLRQKGLRG